MCPYYYDMEKRGVFDGNDGKRRAYSPELWEDWQRFSYRSCWWCGKEMPHSRNFFNIGVREKNAR
jgi:hypothetical protein